MHCLFCNSTQIEVIETRVAEGSNSIRRRRVCSQCKKRFTTYERIEELPILVIKRDGRRERFNREKIRSGIHRSVEKTTITADQVEQIVDQIEQKVRQRDSAEIESQIIGTMVAAHLRRIDKVAYIRFASVFRRFVDIEEFEIEVRRLAQRA